MRWRNRFRIALRCGVFTLVCVALYFWIAVIWGQAIRGYFGAAFNYAYQSDEAAFLLFTFLLLAFVLIWERQVLRWLVPLPRAECPQCGYAIKQLTTKRCPECGYEGIEPQQPGGQR
jgi:hypothetical protein